MKIFQSQFPLIILFKLVLLCNIQACGVWKTVAINHQSETQKYFHTQNSQYPVSQSFLFEQLEWDEENENDEKSKTEKTTKKYSLISFNPNFTALLYSTLLAEHIKKYRCRYCRSALSLVIYFHQWKSDI